MASSGEEEEVRRASACGRKCTAASVSRGAAVLVENEEPRGLLLLHKILHLQACKGKAVEAPTAGSKNCRGYPPRSEALIRATPLQDLAPSSLPIFNEATEAELRTRDYTP